MVRHAAWADQFYPARPVELQQELDRCLAPVSGQETTRAIGCVAPHADRKSVV